MPIPLIWAGLAIGATVVSAIAYSISQMNDDDTSSSSHNRDAEQRQREAREQQIRHKIQAEAEAWLRSQRIALDTNHQTKLLSHLVDGKTLEADVWAALTRASPAIQHAELAVKAEEQSVAEYSALLKTLRSHIKPIDRPEH